jgi:hypothetical protein
MPLLFIQLRACRHIAADLVLGKVLHLNQIALQMTLILTATRRCLSSFKSAQKFVAVVIILADSLGNVARAGFGTVIHLVVQIELGLENASKLTWISFFNLLLQGFVLFNLSRFFISLDKTGQGRLY